MTVKNYRAFVDRTASNDDGLGGGDRRESGIPGDLTQWQQIRDEIQAIRSSLEEYSFGNAREYSICGFDVELEYVRPFEEADGRGPQLRRRRRLLRRTPVRPGARRSRLLVLDGDPLDGETLCERARAALPHAVPFDLHGRYFPELLAASVG